MKNNKSFYIIALALMLMIGSNALFVVGGALGVAALCIYPVALVIFIVGFVMGLKGK
ncbi:MAG: hypothetical protein IJY37_02655 [Clostridia bacterium]|nr:hypothetical protein [Clostridia bacterium]MBQ8419244.1 hypothetical protein [Clostridia bacterium]